MKTSFITKLYYKKYPYKIVIKSEWASDIKYRSLDYFTKMKDKSDKDKIFLFRETRVDDIKIQYHLIEKVYELLKLPKIKTRTEYSTLTFFVEDKNTFDKIKSELSPIVHHVFIPYNDLVLQELLNKNSIEIKAYLTHDCRYKIVLKSTRAEIKEEVRKNFLNLIERNRDKFVISYNAKYALENNKLYYLDNSLVYVRDSKFLMMAQMMIQPIIKEVVSMFTYDEISNKDTENG
jgi:hypothetical protein